MNDQGLKAAPKKNKGWCTCGLELPSHLADIGGANYTHICNCGANYKVEGGGFVRTEDKFKPLCMNKEEK
jgi:hypothetical protein